MRQIAIGDVHGCYHTLKALLENKVQLTQSDQLYFLGDLIDRGPLSKKVIDYIQSLQQNGIDCHVLCGNHEEVACKAYRIEVENSQKKFRLFKSKNPTLDIWLKMGGEDFIKSFNVPSILDVPENYFSFMESLPNYIELDSALLVHAGFNFKIDDIFKDEHAMRWIRDFEVDLVKTNNKPVVHGHVPLPLEFIQQCIEDPNTTFIPLDNGCVYNTRIGMGNLLALELNSRTLFVQNNID